jgi:hypothetical protein
MGARHGSRFGMSLHPAYPSRAVMKARYFKLFRWL